MEVELTIQPVDPWSDFASASKLSEDQFEILDTNGRIWKPSSWALSETKPQFKNGEINVRLNPVDGNLVPWKADFVGAKLRYHELIVMKIEIPFSFTNIGIP